MQKQQRRKPPGKSVQKLETTQQVYRLECAKPQVQQAQLRLQSKHAAPWMHSLKRAMNHGGEQRGKRDRSEAKRKQVQLATVDPVSGRPSVRTIVFRGFVSTRHTGGASESNGESCLLAFITDTRSAKARHLRDATSGQAHVEACWWFDEAGVQFRLSGKGVLATADSAEPELRALCKEVWERLGANTRGTFMWPEPGNPTPPLTHAPVPVKACATDVELKEANFAVLVLLPETVHELRLGGKQQAYVYSLKPALKDDFNHITPGARLGPLTHAGPGTIWSVCEVNP